MSKTYYLLPFPRSTMRSIYKSLKPDGQVIVVDYRCDKNKEPFNERGIGFQPIYTPKSIMTLVGR